MPDLWTAEIIAGLHLNKISKKELAFKMQFTPEYVSMVLNGKKHPFNAEQRFKAALAEIIKEKAPAAAEAE